MKVPSTLDSGGTTYTPVPADNHRGVLIGITDLGTHMESYQGGPSKPKRKVKLQWELPDETRDDGSTAVISSKYNFSFNEKSSFRQMIDSWLGADWVPSNLDTELSELLGKAAMVLVAHGKSDDGRVYAYVQSVSKLPSKMAVPSPTRSEFYLDLDRSKELPEILSGWDAQIIRASQEYQAGGFTDNAPRPGPDGKFQRPGTNTTPAHAGVQGQPSYKRQPDDIPNGDDDDKPPF